MNTELQTTHEPVIDELDKQLLNRMQFDFPFVGSPWEAMAEGLGITGEQVLERVKQLKNAGIIRQVSAIFDTKALGYTSTLAAARVPAERLDAAAAVVSAHPGVSHNYLREAEFNLWFTLAVPPGESLEEHLRRLSVEAGFEDYLPLPTIQTFKIGVKLEMGDADDSAPRSSGGKHHRHKAAVKLSASDIERIRALQEDLPLVDRPFDAICDQLGIGFDALRRWVLDMQDAGVLRRYAAILRHRRAGFVANGMVVWRVAEEHIDEAGRTAALAPEVSHCYQRPCSTAWPYNLYTMIHARSESECQSVIDRIAADLTPFGVTDRRTLYSTTEFKKQRIRYFVD
jgi:DNA-binding Lrp family transcriptional regulator